MGIDMGCKKTPPAMGIMCGNGVIFANCSQTSPLLIAHKLLPLRPVWTPLLSFRGGCQWPGMEKRDLFPLQRSLISSGQCVSPPFLEPIKQWVPPPKSQWTFSLTFGKRQGQLLLRAAHPTLVTAEKVVAPLRKGKESTSERARWPFQAALLSLSTIWYLI